MTQSETRANQQPSAAALPPRCVQRRKAYATRNFTRRAGTATSLVGFGPVSSPLTRTKRYASPSRK